MGEQHHILPFTMFEALPSRFLELKKEIASTYPNFAESSAESWNDILEELKTTHTDIAKAGPDVTFIQPWLILSRSYWKWFQYIPQVNFADLNKLNKQDIEKIKRRGCIVIRNVVEDAEAIHWRKSLEEFVKANPDVEGQSSPASAQLSSEVLHASIESFSI